MQSFRGLNMRGNILILNLAFNILEMKNLRGYPQDDFKRDLARDFSEMSICKVMCGFQTSCLHTCKRFFTLDRKGEESRVYHCN